MDFSKLRKLEGLPKPSTENTNDTVVAVIMKVTQAGYVPSCTTLRTRIDGFIVTADVKMGDIATLEADPLVVSVSLGKTLRTVQLSAADVNKG